jgi:hypothetical protein
MNRWDHIILTTTAFVLVWALLQYFLPGFLPARFSFWLLLVAWVGGIFPDFDVDWQPLLGHRSVVTHSAFAATLIAGIIILPLRWLGLWTDIDRYFVVVFLAGCALHLLLDLVPSSKSILNRFLKNPLLALAYIERGKKATPGNITKIPEKWERPWLIVNAILLGLVAALIWTLSP